MEGEQKGEGRRIKWDNEKEVEMRMYGGKKLEIMRNNGR
jgi:hypothetical protein